MATVWSPLLIITFYLTGVQVQEVTSRPNIVTIMADDMGWNDVSFHGSNQILTPNIDALAYNGVILNRHYTMPTCTPSRTAYLTGKYPIRTGMQGEPLWAGEPRGLPLQEVTLPQRLKELGYRTALVGKWHQGSYRSEYTPNQRGFDSFLGYWNGFIGYFNHTISYLDKDGQDGLDFHCDNCETDQYEGIYATDVFTREAIDIIETHDTSRPLYLLLSHLAVHTGSLHDPLEVPDVKRAEEDFQNIKSPQRRRYAEMVRLLDKSTGLVVKALQSKGILNNTIVVFMSDNGAPTQGDYPNWGSNWPLRGIKKSLHEGGVRGVAAIWSPSFQETPRVSNQLFHLSDWLPTLYSAAGGKVTDLGPLDGIDQWESLIDSNMTNPRTQVLLNVEDGRKTEALINGVWKIFKSNGFNSDMDGYSGDSGHASKILPYDTKSIIQSDVNRAIIEATLKTTCRKEPINEKTILSLRTESKIKCPKVVDKKKEISCDNYCLYDIQKDPCEIHDLADINAKIFKELVQEIAQYRSEAHPLINKQPDPDSNPVLHNKTWISWLDKDAPLVDFCTSS